MCQKRKYKNKKTQIHKYTNTAYDEVPERPNMWYIFEKRIVQGYQKSYSHVSNTQLQKYKVKIHKYTNTQAQTQIQIQTHIQIQNQWMEARPFIVTTSSSSAG